MAFHSYLILKKYYKYFGLGVNFLYKGAKKNGRQIQLKLMGIRNEIKRTFLQTWI